MHAKASVLTAQIHVNMLIQRYRVASKTRAFAVARNLYKASVNRSSVSLFQFYHYIF